MSDIPCATCQTPVPESALFCPACGNRTGRGDSRAAAAEDQDVPGRLTKALGSNYVVRRLLGEGGFAQVFEVWDTALERRLAVKVLKPDIAWSSGMIDRFKQETRSIARLNHSNILAIHFVGEGEGLVYYAMPFVEGEALSSLLRRQGALPPDRALGILRPLLDALSHAHEMGLIHRDIKPDNVMLEASTGRPLLVDFGIAKRIDGEGHKTQTGFVVGTPQYMSPEQALGQADLDARTDLYAVGAMLYQMVTGAPPFEGDTSQEIVGKHLSEPAPIASAKNARIPVWLSDVIVRCLAKRPGERFQSAAMLLDALQKGRMSGPQDPVSAERIAVRLQSEKATALMPSAERRVSAAAATAVTPVRKKRSGMTLLLLLLVGGAGVAIYLFRFQPALLTVENRLVEPIRLVLGNETVEIAAGAAIERKVSRRGPLVAQWYLVRPEGPSGPLGVELQGSISIAEPRGKLRHTVHARSGQRPVFAPLITNETDGALGITVNPGTAAVRRCDCTVRPGTVRGHIGYYDLFQNSAVVGTLPGRAATFRDLGGKVDLLSGTVGLKFNPRGMGRVGG